jgi:hypothetical protein
MLGSSGDTHVPLRYVSSLVADAEMILFDSPLKITQLGGHFEACVTERRESALNGDDERWMGRVLPQFYLLQGVYGRLTELSPLAMDAFNGGGCAAVDAEHVLVLKEAWTAATTFSWFGAMARGCREGLSEESLEDESAETDAVSMRVSVDGCAGAAIAEGSNANINNRRIRMALRCLLLKDARNPSQAS